MGGVLKLAPAKQAHIPEPDMATWRQMTHDQLVAKGFRTTGHEPTDRKLRLPNMPLLNRTPPETQSDVTECDICDTPITDLFLDAVIRDCGVWGKICVACHNKNGIGYGPGRATLYALKDDIFTRVPYVGQVQAEDQIPA